MHSLEILNKCMKPNWTLKWAVIRLDFISSIWSLYRILRSNFLVQELLP